MNRHQNGSKKLSRLTPKQKILLGEILPMESPAEAAERTGYGPNLTLEGGYLTLRWSAKQAREALDSAGMTLEEVLETHLAPRLDAVKTVSFRHRGEVRDKREVPDLRTRLEALKLCFTLHGILLEE